MVRHLSPIKPLEKSIRSTFVKAFKQDLAPEKKLAPSDIGPENSIMAL